MIPKIIHYCWFGKNQIPDEAQKCINSWKKYCPGYEIREWNEDNFDVSICRYTREAYTQKKWAFVSDYARLWILLHEGGVYFDVDVELIQGIDDLINNGSFMGFEHNIYGENGVIYDDFSGVGINPGIGLAAEKGLPIFAELIEDYNNRSFIKSDGSNDTTSIVDYVTKKFVERGLVLESKEQVVEQVTIYPIDYFGPMNYYTGEITTTVNTRAIHRYAATWTSSSEYWRQKIRHMFIKLFGYNFGKKFYNYLKKIVLRQF